MAIPVMVCSTVAEVAIIFKSWYKEHLCDVPVYPVSGFVLWVLSGSEDSYPYRGYIVEDLEYLAVTTSTCKTVTALAFI